MLFIFVIIFALSIVAFWIDQDNTEEMHLLMILALILLGLVLISLSPWPVQLIVIFLSFMPKFFLSILHYIQN